MRIELPLPAWNDFGRVQDDAHTLTLPPQHGLAGEEPPWAPEDEEGAALRTEVACRRPLVLTLTF